MNWKHGFLNIKSGILLTLLTSAIDEMCEQQLGWHTT